MLVGQSVLRREDDRFLTGRGRFVDDVAARTPAPLYAVFVRSPHAHAAIGAIDGTRAAAMPGVRAILTGADWAREGLGRLPCVAGIPFADGRPMNQALRAGLAPGVARYVGDPVAVVIAETWPEAAAAAEAVAVDYRAMPAVVAPGAALAADAPLVHAEFAANLAFDKTVGDAAAVEAALARAAHVETLDLVNNRITANAIEPRTYLADHEAFAGRTTLWTASQTPHLVRRWIAAHSLGIPEHTFRVVAPDVGGGFGMKSHYPEEPVLVWAARKLAAPIRWTATRSESLASDSHARDHASAARLGFDAAGRIVALDVRTIGGIGAYATTFGPLILGAAYVNLLSGLYAIPLIHARIRGVYTHTAPIGPYRGAGRPEAIYLIERLIENAARALGLDPAELRRRNLIPPAALPYRSPAGPTYADGDYPRLLEALLERAGYDGLRAWQRARRTAGELVGIGLACYLDRAGVGPSRSGSKVIGEFGSWDAASVRVHPSGKATVLTGHHSHGQSHETVFAQIAADRLQLPLAAIDVVQGDTDRTPFGNGTWGSRSATIGGSAVKLAADRVVEKGRALAAHILECAPADLDFRGGRYVVTGTDRAIEFALVAKAAHHGGDYPDGFEPGLEATAAYDPPAFNFPAGVQLCVVSVDRDTGAVRILDHLAIDDVGNRLNPMVVAGQIQGGIVQGLGQALCEQIVYDAAGQLVTGSFMDYAMPRADDLPAFTLIEADTRAASNPLGVKGIGESGPIGAPPALVNAVVDALAPLGVRHIDMPLTPERVWRAIQAARAD